jgi:hypothetical protein
LKAGTGCVGRDDEWIGGTLILGRGTCVQTPPSCFFLRRRRWLVLVLGAGTCETGGFVIIDDVDSGNGFVGEVDDVCGTDWYVVSSGCTEYCGVCSWC